MVDALIQQDHSLYNEWVYWVHLPHDTNWSINSYTKIYNIDSVEKAISITESIPEQMVQNCMIFIMKKGIDPIWEDVKNKDGGCFSYKISNKHIYKCWNSLSYALFGNILTSPKYNEIINGITISPKKNFGIIKIWLSSSKYQNPNIINKINEYIIPNDCLFKKH